MERRKYIIPLLIWIFIGVSPLCAIQSSSMRHSATSTEHDMTSFCDLNNIMQNATLRDGCCDDKVEDYVKNWALYGKYLTTYLETLKAWNCTDFVKECKYRPYAVNEFTSLVYKYFCNSTAFLEECSDVISDVKEISASSAKEESKTLLTTSLTRREILQPCVQVGLYNASLTDQSINFHEIVEVFLPFCEFIWCGFDDASMQKYHLSAWDCLSQGCKAGVVIDIIFAVILGIIVIFANFTVLAVYLCDRKLQNNQAVFKISLAFSDVITGLIVFPTFISTLVVLVWSHENVWKSVANPTFVGHNGSEESYYNPGGSYLAKFPEEYFEFVGFFTTISIAVSGYTLIAASCDRCIALYKPLVYGKQTLKRIVVCSIIAVWILCIVFAMLPIMISTLSYSLDASLLVTNAGKDAIIVYVVAFFLPLTTLWLITIFSYFLAKRFVKQRRKLTCARRSEEFEARITRTLGLMVAAFSFSILPILILLICSFFLPGIYYQNRYLLPHHQEGAVVYNSAKLIAVRILLCNSLWNVLIYSVKNKDFLDAAKKLYSKIWARLTCKEAHHFSSQVSPIIKSTPKKKTCSTPPFGNTSGDTGGDKNSTNVKEDSV